MRLHCLGTAGYHPSETRHTSCYFLPESGIVLDAGSGMFRLPPLIETDSLDILLTHCHLDHVFGLTFLLDVLFQRPVETVRIWGEGEKLDAVRSHLFSELIFPVPLDAQWFPIDNLDEFHIGKTRVTWRTQPHPGGSVAYRLECSQSAKSMVYLTDTVGETDDGAIEWASGADLMLHECNFRNEHEPLAEKTGHSFSSRVGQIATAAKPGKLVLVHANPLDGDPGAVMDEVREAFRGEVVAGFDGLVVEG